VESCFNAEDEFCGTAIRLPFRTVHEAKESSISDKAVEPSEIRQLLDDFIRDEIGITLLFLHRVTSIEIYDIDDDESRLLARAELRIGEASDPFIASNDSTDTTFTRTIVVDIEGNETATSWRFFKTVRSQETSISLLNNRLKRNASSSIKKNKLQASVALAMPLSHQEILRKAGRLFTYLPLPLKTGFPCHVHGLFALTPDRQHLRNGEEMGLVEGSDDQYEYFCVSY
jgi:hypothetical protein